MKRLILLGIFLFTVSFSSAANKMSMVTYFPVPYVAYSQVSVDQQLDVGLTNTCTMNLGCRESGTNLNANTVNLKSGKLELNQGKGVLGNSITLGSGLGNGQIQFKNVRIQGGDMQSLNANTMNMKELQLFGHKFPPCKGKGGSDGQMHWTELSLKGAGAGKKELYLVCGNAATSEEDPGAGKSVCTDWEYGTPGAGMDWDGKVMVSGWTDAPKCSDVGGETGGDFVGKCVAFRISSSYAWKSKYYALETSGECPKNECGSLGNLENDFFNQINGAAVCNQICPLYGNNSGYYCTVSETDCVIHSTRNNTCQRFALSCRRTGVVLLLRTCEKSS